MTLGLAGKAERMGTASQCPCLSPLGLSHTWSPVEKSPPKAYGKMLPTPRMAKSFSLDLDWFAQKKETESKY